jgi:GNAT superfamily N-acetyltransferase
MTLVYRDAGPDDAALLTDLFKRVFCETFAHLYDPADLAAFLAEHGEAQWREQLSDPDFSERLAEGAGYAKVGPLRLPVEPAEEALELRQLYILPQWRGEGVAGRLMDWTIAEARKRAASELYLSVFTENPRARRFYDRYGFDEVGPYKFMVGKQADEDVIMRLKL